LKVGLVRFMYCSSTEMMTAASSVSLKRMNSASTEKYWFSAIFAEAAGARGASGGGASDASDVSMRAPAPTNRRPAPAGGLVGEQTGRLRRAARERARRARLTHAGIVAHLLV
jgi:hypothetical protein